MAPLKREPLDSFQPVRALPRRLRHDGVARFGDDHATGSRTVVGRIPADKGLEYEAVIVMGVNEAFRETLFNQELLHQLRAQCGASRRVPRPKMGNCCHLALESSPGGCGIVGERDGQTPRSPCGGPTPWKPSAWNTSGMPWRATPPPSAASPNISPPEAPGDKIFPPTYERGSYATEMRHMGGEEVPCVLLDSVQSQANRMELALLEEWESGRVPLPVISVAFTGPGLPRPFRVTSLEAPHRIADALLRDSELDGVMFRDSDTGKRLDTLDVRNATALFELCPTALVFGMWDSTGPAAGPE